MSVLPLLLFPVLAHAGCVKGAKVSSCTCTHSSSCCYVDDSCVQSTAALSEEMQNTLDQHNVYRCMHGVPLLVWDKGIAATAQAYADEGYYGHSPKSERNFRGENLAGGKTMTGALAATYWYSEIEFTEKNLGYKSGRRRAYGTADFMKDTVPAGKAIGHYTQIVWNDTTKVGCGKAKMRHGGDDLIVCQYAPAGNVVYDRVESARIGRMVSGFPGNVFAPIKTAVQCGSKRVEDIAMPQSCTPSRPLPHGSLCSYGWQCETTFCCPNLRVCLLRSGSSVSSQDLSRLVVDEHRSSVISSVLRRGGTCKDSLWFGDKCLQTREGQPLRTWNQSRCGCTGFYMQQYSSCSWVSLNKGVTCNCDTSNCTVTTCKQATTITNVVNTKAAWAWTGPYNTDIPGTGFAGSLSDSVAKCKARCVVEPECQAIQYSATDRNGGKNCFLFDNQEDTGAQYKTFKTYKIYKHSQQATCYVSRTLVADEGGNVGNGVSPFSGGHASANLCKQQCSTRSGCNSFALCESGHSGCWFKDKVVTPTSPSSTNSKNTVTRGCKTYYPGPCQASTPTTPPPSPPPVTTVTTVTTVNTVTIAESKKANGVACEASADCTSGVCTSKKCVAVAVFAAAKKVSGDLKIKMPAANATTFKTDPKVKIALQDAIAGQIPGVEKQMVEILEIMEVPTRRLSASDRLLSEAGSTTLKVMYEITLPKDMIVSNVTTAMTGEAAKTSLATLVNKELKKQNISATISVEETTAAESAPTTILAPVSTSFAQLSNGLSNMLMSMIGVHLGFALRDVHMQ